MNKTKTDLIIENENLRLINKQLKYQLDNFESLQRCKCCDCCEDAIEKYKEGYFEFEEFKRKIKEVFDD